MTEKMAKRRVKLYTLNPDRQWDDRGTGHVTSLIQERPKTVSLLVKAEVDGATLLESRIMSDTAYQRQQGTLIVWSEGDSYDLALSFQEKAGCEEIWEKICQVQGKDPSVDITQEMHEESEDERYDESAENLEVELPQCEINNLEEINETMSSCLLSPGRKDRLAILLDSEGYIRKLITIFHNCESAGNIHGLHQLYEIFKQIFHLNKNTLFELMFSEEMMFHVVGALEYDPSCAYPKRHRQYLKSVAKFREVIPIDNKELLSKIHQTYRIQYIQDVVLPTPQVCEENVLSTLSSFIFFNKVEIVNILQDDEKLLAELFNQLNKGEDDLPIEKRRELILFLKEFCTFSQTLQPIAREKFLKTLSSLGVLPVVEIGLCLEDSVTKAASVDILTFIVEFSPSFVREYMLLQQGRVMEEQYLINIIIEQMFLDMDPEMGGAVQLNVILRILVDPENMVTNTKSERPEFLSFLYKHAMHFLVAPLLSNSVGDDLEKKDYQTAQLLALILELLTFCVEHHLYHIKYYVVQRELLKRVLVFLASDHTFLVLCAVRFMRRIIGKNDDFYNRHIISGKLFSPLIHAFLRNNGRYNLLDSAIIEMFHCIIHDKMKTLVFHIVECYDNVLSQIEYVPTFRELKVLYNGFISGEIEEDKETDGPGVVRETNGAMAIVGAEPGRYRANDKYMNEDADENAYLNADEVAMKIVEDTPVEKVVRRTYEPEESKGNDLLKNSSREGCINPQIEGMSKEVPDISRKTAHVEVSPPSDCQVSPVGSQLSQPMECDEMSPPIDCDGMSPTDILIENDFSVKNDSTFTGANKENHVACNLNEMRDNCKSAVLMNKKVSLVDYDENSDDDEEIAEDGGKEMDVNPSPSKRPRLEAD